MQMYRLALIGFGTVGQGLAQIVRDRGAALAEQYGVQFRIVAVSDMMKGSIYHPEGFDPAVLLDAIATEDSLEGVAAPASGWDAERTIEEVDADVVVEVSFTDLETGEPARTHVEKALARGRHVVTSNKGPIALHYHELSALAHEQGVEIGVEGTVMSGTPAVRLGTELLAGAGVTRIQGILNGTTNYILTQMEKGATYDDALADAQQRGYAEADPTGDVEGHDAAGKVVILANLVLGHPIGMQDVDMQGITGVTPDDIARAREAEERWKLIGDLRVDDDTVAASVKPMRIPLSHPLASVSGATNAITYSTDLLGDVTLVGPGAGKLETGYALIADMLAIHRRNA